MTNIDVLFPVHFLPVGRTRPGPHDADILCELRTQRFLQMFLDGVEGDSDEDWEPKAKVEALFQIASTNATAQLAPVTHLTIRNLMYQFHESYLRIAGIRVKNVCPLL